MKSSPRYRWEGWDFVVRVFFWMGKKAGLENTLIAGVMWFALAFLNCEWRQTEVVEDI